MVYKNVYLLLTGAEDYKYDRAKKLLKLLNKKNDFKNDLIIISGLSSFDPYKKVSKAKKYKSYLEKNSSKLPKIILEEKAMDTLGNMIFSYEIIKEIIKKEKQTINVFLITENYHIKRSKWLFEQVFVDLKKQLNVEFISSNTLFFQKIMSIVIILLFVILLPIIWLFKLIIKNKYIKDLLILKLTKKDFYSLKLNSYNKIHDFTYSLSIYESYKKVNKLDLKKSIYSKALDYIRK